jgi:hypothetical protein
MKALWCLLAGHLMCARWHTRTLANGACYREPGAFCLRCLRPGEWTGRERWRVEG